MHLRSIFVLAAIAFVLAVPAALAAQPAGPVASASGGVHWTIPLPNAFGVEVINQPLAFNARKYADGTVSGQFEYHQIVEGTSFNFNVDVTCMNVYDGNRAKIGGVVRAEQRPNGSRGHLRVVPGLRQRRGANAPPDQSSLVGFGDEAANEAFCNSPNLPRFGPWDVQGNVQVHGALQPLPPNEQEPCPSIRTHGDSCRSRRGLDSRRRVHDRGMPRSIPATSASATSAFAPGQPPAPTQPPTRVHRRRRSRAPSTRRSPYLGYRDPRAR